MPLGSSTTTTDTTTDTTSSSTTNQTETKTVIVQKQYPKEYGNDDPTTLYILSCLALCFPIIPLTIGLISYNCGKNLPPKMKRAFYLLIGVSLFILFGGVLLAILEWIVDKWQFFEVKTFLGSL